MSLITMCMSRLFPGSLDASIGSSVAARAASPMITRATSIPFFARTVIDLSDQHPGDVHHRESADQASCHRQVHEPLGQRLLPPHLSQDLHNDLRDRSNTETQEQDRQRP